MSATSLTEQLVQDLAKPITPSVEELAALHVLDWLATAIGALGTEEGQLLSQYVNNRPTGCCHAIGCGRRDSAIAAFSNAGLSIILELDDLHLGARLHPADVVVAAALACAERENSSGNDLLQAVIRGYEVMIRVGESVGDAHYRFWHNTSTCGPFGAAAAVAGLLGLDDEATVNALGNAGTQSSGLWQCRLERTMSKPIHAGRAAEAGLLAADLAALGVTGPRFILEGELGLFAATSPDADPVAISRPAEGWKLEETAFKPWATCGHANAAIDATLSLRESVSVDAIQKIHVRTYEQAVVFADCPDPRTTYDAKFSIQHAVAVALVGDLSPKEFEAEYLDHPQVRQLREKVQLEVGDGPNSSKDSAWGAHVSVMTDGGTEEAICDNPKGSPANPMSADEVVAKANALLAEAGLEPREADALVEAVLDLASGGDLGQVVSRIP